MWILPSSTLRHVPSDPPEADFAPVADAFAAHRARAAALEAQARSWAPTEPPRADDMALGTFDTVAPLEGDQIGNVYARLAALSVQRLRVLGAQLREQYAAHGMAAFVRDRLIYNPGTQEVETAGEEPTALARLELDERKLLQNLLTAAVRLKLETQSQAARDMHGARMAAFAQAFAEKAGMDWSAPETRRLAQAAVLSAEAQMTGR